MPPNHFESEVESFLEGSHGDRTHIKRADHHTVTPLCGTLLVCPRRPRAHPRSHRENRSDMQEFLNALGSSPLMRGKRIKHLLEAVPRGLISTHAGKTAYVVTPWCYAEGSSPLTRGKRRLPASGALRDGLIPAHAGKTSQSSVHRACPRVHPRSRGENFSKPSSER